MVRLWNWNDWRHDGNRLKGMGFGFGETLLGFVETCWASLD